MSTPAQNLTDPLDALIGSLPPSRPKTSNRYGAYDLNTEGAWTLSSDAPKVKDWYKSTYGRDLPVSAFGQSRRHSGMGLNHSNSMDVGINPTSAEGQALISHLRENNIPFLAYDRAVPGAATAAHVHVGFPSHGFGVTPQQKSTGRQQQQDPLDGLISALPSSTPTPTSGDELDGLISSLPASPAPPPPSQGEAVGVTPTVLPSRGTTQSPAQIVDVPQNRERDTNLPPPVPAFAPGTLTRRGQQAVRGTVVNRAPTSDAKFTPGVNYRQQPFDPSHLAPMSPAEAATEFYRHYGEQQGLQGQYLDAFVGDAVKNTGADFTYTENNQPISKEDFEQLKKTGFAGVGVRGSIPGLARKYLESQSTPSVSASPSPDTAGALESFGKPQSDDPVVNHLLAERGKLAPVELTPQEQGQTKAAIALDETRPAVMRVFEQPTEGMTGELFSQVGNVLARFAPGLKDSADTLRHAGLSLEMQAQADHAKNDPAGYLEEAGKYLVSTGLTVAQLELLRTRTGAPLPAVMGAQALANNLDKDPDTQRREFARALLYGKALEAAGGLKRLASAGVFGGSELAQGLYAGDDPKHLIARTAGGALTGAAFGGGENAKSVGEHSRGYVQRDIESDLRSGQPTETIAPPVNVRGRERGLVSPAEPEGGRTAGEGGAEVEGPRPEAEAPPQVRHVDVQARRKRSTPTGQAGQFRTETNAEAEARRAQVTGGGLAESKAPAISGAGVEAEGVKPVAEGDNRPAPETTIQGLEHLDPAEVEGRITSHLNERLGDDELVDFRVVGSRTKGRATPESDLDVVVEYRGKTKEDDLFNWLNADENRLKIDGVDVDFTPVRRQESGTLKRWLKDNAGYEKPEGMRAASEKRDYEDYIKKGLQDFPSRIDKLPEGHEVIPQEFMGRSEYAVRKPDGTLAGHAKTPEAAAKRFVDDYNNRHEFFRAEEGNSETARASEVVRPEGQAVASGQAGEVQQPGAGAEVSPESQKGAGERTHTKVNDFYSALLDAQANGFEAVPRGFGRGKLTPAQEGEIREAIGALPKPVLHDLARDMGSGDAILVGRARDFLSDENIARLAETNRTGKGNRPKYVTESVDRVPPEGEAGTTNRKPDGLSLTASDLDLDRLQRDAAVSTPLRLSRNEAGKTHILPAGKPGAKFTEAEEGRLAEALRKQGFKATKRTSDSAFNEKTLTAGGGWRIHGTWGDRYAAGEAPAPPAVRGRAKVEKVNARTGLKPSQTEYLAGELVKVADKAIGEASGEGAMQPREMREHFAKEGGLPKSFLSTPMEKSVTIKVPDDGEFTIRSGQAANRLHQKITGKPIEGFERAEGTGLHPTHTTLRSATSETPASLDDYVKSIGGERQALGVFKRLSTQFSSDPQAEESLGFTQHDIDRLTERVRDKLDEKRSVEPVRDKYLAEVNRKIESAPSFDKLRQAILDYKLKRAGRGKVRRDAATSDVADMTPEMLLAYEPAVQDKVAKRGIASAKASVRREADIPYDYTHGDVDWLAYERRAIGDDAADAKYFARGRTGEEGKLDISFLSPVARGVRRVLGVKEPETIEPSFRLRGRRENVESSIRGGERGTVPEPQPGRVSTVVGGGAARGVSQDVPAPEVGAQAGRQVDTERVNSEGPIRRAVLPGAEAAKQETAEPSGAPVSRLRSFPRSAEAAGLTKGTDLTYEVVGDKASVDRANRRIETNGADRVAADIARTGEPTKDDVVAGQILARKYSEAGDHEREVGVINDLSDKLTRAGQTVQAASLISRLSPEGVLLRGQKILNKRGANRALTADEALALKESAAQVRESEAKIADLEKRVEEMRAAARSKQGVENLIRAESRRASRAQTRQTLDEEFASLKAQFAKAKAETKGVQPSGLAGLDPEGKLTPLVLKMARNRVKAGVNTVEGLVDEIHSALKEHVEGLTKRDVRDLISGYGREAKDNQSADAKELARLRSEMQKLSKQEDVASGVRSVRREGPPDWLPAAKRRLQRQIDEYERRAREGEYARRPKRETPEGDAELKGLISQRDAERGKARAARAELDRQFKLLSRTRGQQAVAKTGQVLGTLNRNALLTIRGAARILSGMSTKQAADAVARMIETPVDVAVSRVRGTPRTQSALGPVGLTRATIEGAKDGVRNAYKALKGSETKFAPAEEPITGIKPLDFAVNSMQRLYSAKEQALRSYAYNEAKQRMARTFALNDLKEGVIKSGEVGARTKEYASDNPPPLGALNSLVSAEMAKTQADYDTQVKRLEGLTTEGQREKFGKDLYSLMDSVALRASDEQVYAEPSRIADRVTKATNALGAPGKVVRNLYLPFMRRPSNALVDFFQTYVGAPLNIPVQGARMMAKPFSVEAQTRFAKSVGRGTVGYSIIGLGYSLAAGGLMKGVNGPDKTKAGAININGKWYPVWKVPFVGWLLGLGATLHDEGLKGEPRAMTRMVLEHPLLRGVGELGRNVENVSDAVQTGSGKALTKEGVRTAGGFASRLVPQPLPVIAEGSDTKERVTNEAVTQPTISRIPFARQTLTPFAEKPRTSVVDPFYSQPPQPKASRGGRGSPFARRTARPNR